ncbi:MAG: 3-oxoacyl-ACP synthase III [Pirellulales bacterium]
MQYQNVCIESVGYCLPPERVSSTQLEQRLRPLYERLRLPEGRLELMSGIRERRVWRTGVLPSDKSVISGQQALVAANWAPSRVGALIHASVCRDHLEPATACKVHHLLGLPPDCLIYDVSNACLGLLNGVLQIANMIELGQIESGLVLGSEGSRALMEATIDALNRDESLTRSSIKPALASLTIGSASAAILLTQRKASQTGNRLVAAARRTHSQFHGLCQSGRDEAAADGMRPLMDTDSERLLEEGVATGAATFADFQRVTGWRPGEIQRTICHQVGSAHRRRMLETFELDPERDFTTFEWLGNTGAAALPVSLGLAARQGWLDQAERLALLGIGSGINCLMLAVEWRQSLVSGMDEAADACFAGQAT